MMQYSVVPRRGGWFSRAGESYDVVIGTKLRLLRNMEAYPFRDTISAEDALALRKEVEHLFAGFPEEYICLDGDAMRSEHRDFYRDRGILDSTRDGAVAVITRDERVQVLLGEEDHLEIAATDGGWTGRDTLNRVQAMDRRLEDSLHWAVSLRLGYLAPRVETVGTGLIAEALLFLPALQKREEVTAVEGIPRDRVSVQPARAGTVGHDALFTVRCAAVFPEEELRTVTMLEETVERLVHYERDARDVLVKRHTLEFSDAVHRALGALSHARTLSLSEALDETALIRLGSVCGVIDFPDSVTATELLFQADDSAVQVLNEDHQESLDVRRATLMRRSLTDRD